MNNTPLDQQVTGGIFVALGSNSAFTDCEKQLLEGASLFQSVLRALERADVLTLQKSSLWLSPAWPDPTRGDFYNAVVELAPNCMDAQALMRLLLELEDEYGRIRSVKNASRTLDLDLIDYRGLILSPELEGDLILPHPRMHSRSFVLSPLLEIAPEWTHPSIEEFDIEAFAKNAQKEWPSRKIGEF